MSTITIILLCNAMCSVHGTLQDFIQDFLLGGAMHQSTRLFSPLPNGKKSYFRDLRFMVEKHIVHVHVDYQF